jgi:hypothetical protein
MRIRHVTLLGTGFLALLVSCRPVPHRTTPLRTEGPRPSRDEVLALMRELAPDVAPCVPRDRRYIQLKVTLDGQTGTIASAEVTGSTTQARPEDPAVQECASRALVGRPALFFPQPEFNVSFPFGG